MSAQPNNYTYHPRPYHPHAPSFPANEDRFSSASNAISSIGNILSSPYDTDDSDTEDVIRTPSDRAPHGASPIGNNTGRGDRRLTQTRQVPVNYMRSVAGEVEVIAFDQNRSSPSPTARPAGRVDAQGNKRVTIVDFPSPSISPSSEKKSYFPQQQQPTTPPRIYNPTSSPIRKPSPGGLAYPSPARSGPMASPSPRTASASPARGYPQPQARPQLHLLTQTAATHGLLPPRQIPDLPPPASPIIPILAQPPPSHASPLPRFLGPAAGNRDSTASGVSTNESIAGYDSMKEKNALFRGGEEELLAFSPRIKKMGQGPGAANRGTWMGGDGRSLAAQAGTFGSGLASWARRGSRRARRGEIHAGCG